MPSGHLAIGFVLFANEETITDRALFVTPASTHLPSFPAGSSVVIEYVILEGRNVLANLPASRT